MRSKKILQQTLAHCTAGQGACGAAELCSAVKKNVSSLNHAFVSLYVLNHSKSRTSLFQMGVETCSLGETPNCVQLCPQGACLVSELNLLAVLVLPVSTMECLLCSIGSQSHCLLKI